MIVVKLNVMLREIRIVSLILLFIVVALRLVKHIYIFKWENNLAKC